MVVVEIVLAAVVVFGVAAVAMGYGGSITHFRPDWPGGPLPEDRTLRSDDVTSVRFSLALRGYRMDEVDGALDRLAGEIADRDARIEQLTGRRYEAGDASANESPVEPPAASPVAASPVAASPAAVSPAANRDLSAADGHAAARPDETAEF